MLDQSDICAVVVTFDPDEGIRSRLESLRSESQRVIVVDNSIGQHPVLDALSGSHTAWDILRIGRNIGVAAALNRGLRRAIEYGHSWMLTLDQDSAPGPGMIDALVRTYQRHPNREQLAIVAAVPEDTSLDIRPRFLRKRGWLLYERVACDGERLDDVSTVITSGSLLKASCFEALGGFREDFFIDYVDTEYCLRALTRGYRIAVACEARLQHRLGDRTREQRGPIVLYPTRHSPTRWYYISRNRIPMLRLYALRFPHWLSYEIAASTFGLVRMLVTEDRRVEKIKAVLRGTWDGLRGRMGPMPGPTAD